MKCDPDVNPPCVTCGDESDLQCFVCLSMVCRDHAESCVACTAALCGKDAVVVLVDERNSEAFCRECLAKELKKVAA